MKKGKSKLESLSLEEIEGIASHFESRDDIPLVKSKQVNMRLTGDLLKKVKELAKAQGLPYTTFLTKLISEDVERLWGVYKN